MAQSEWSFTPICFWRRGNLPFRQLTELIPERTLAILAEIDSTRAERVRLGEQLVTTLYAMVPASTPKERRELIALQRDIHNDRPPAARTLRGARGRLGPAEDAALSEWLELHQREAELEREAGTIFESEMRTARKLLARLGSHDDLARGLQLSGSLLQRNVEAFATAVAATGDTTAELRKIEKTLVSYLYRMTLKPSPFGSFTSVGAQPWAPPPDSAAAGMDERIRLIRLSRMLVLLMERPLYRLQELREYLTIRLANTALPKDGRIEVFTRGADGDEKMYTGERFVNVPRNALVDAIWTSLQASESTGAKLLQELTGMGVPEEQGRTFIERLVEVGMLERSLGIPEQAPDYVQRMAEVLAAIPGELAAHCGKATRELAALEQQFATASVAHRDQLLESIHGQVNSYLSACGEQGIAPEDTRSLIFEDVSSACPPGSWEPEVLIEGRENLAMLQSLLPLFDNSALERLGLYELFASHYGPDGTCNDPLDFYRHFARLDNQAISDLMLGRGTQHAGQMRELRRTFLEHLRDRLAEEATSPTIQLDPAWFENFLKQFPDYIGPADSVAYRMQLYAEGNERGLVINGAVMGHGAQYSRFCDLVDSVTTPRGWLSAAVREADLRHWQGTRSTDIISVLGINTNLHPRLTQMELEYPRSRAYPDPERVLHLRDLMLVGDARHKRIQIVSKRDGQPLRLVPMNFLFPAAGPVLYRFLCAMTPFVNFRTELWGRYLTHFGAAGMDRTAFPRVQLGNVVLQRRAWYHRVDAIPEIEVEEDAGVSVLRNGAAWQRQLGLPREGFYRISEAPAEGGDIGDWVEEVKKWSLAARRARLRKPHYIDFANPFLLKVLFKQLETVSGGYFTVQECLPGTGTYTANHGPVGAEEFVIELNRLVREG